MKVYLIRFRAEYYCQGFEWAWFDRLIEANTFEEACTKIYNLKTPDWELQTPQLFKNLTL